MEKIAELMRSAKRSVQRSARNAVANMVRACSDTSRMHVVMVQGEDVYDALCTLEQQDSTGLRRAMPIQQSFGNDVHVRMRELGEYSVALVVVEWPLHPTHEIRPQVTLLSVLATAVKDERQVDGITLVADEWLISMDPDFNACFVEKFPELQRLGYHPRAIVQRCENFKTLRLPFDAEYLMGSFCTPLNLHHLLAKNVDPL